jgi:hypothetical protein
MNSSSAPGWAVRLGALAFIVVFGLALAACGVSGPGGANGTLTGDVVAGPTCPVQKAGTTCQPKPVANRDVKILDSSGKVVATTKTDASGHFSVALAPGAYVIQVAIVAGQPGMRQTTPGNVTVTTGQTVNVKIELDTGIR